MASPHPRVDDLADIVLSTLNARYSHASLGLRYLYANLGELQPRARIEEGVIGTPVPRMLERLLAHSPAVVGFGVYIWNVAQTTALVKALRAAAPQVKVVLGGPEVSHELDGQEIVALADHVVTGPGDITFAKLCRQLLHGPRPLSKVIAGEQPELTQLASPYPHYRDEDIAHRHLYVEASRGCPFKCEFCLSALDRTAWPFDTDAFLAQLAELHRRGARRFKFVDRTFNLKPATSLAILQFFLERLEANPRDPVFAHFELVPDHLPESLRQAIQRFPPGSLQLEIGIQTWNPQVQATIGRRQDNARAEANLDWLRTHSAAHLHVDLIAGLPGEDRTSFGEGFDRLHALAPHEIQVGLLKRLRGAPIARHTQAFGMRYQSEAPYRVLSTAHLAEGEVEAIARFARFWDLVANSGRFRRTIALALRDGSAFERFATLAHDLHARLGTTHHVPLERLAESLREAVIGLGADEREVDDAVIADYLASGASGRPAFLARGIAGRARQNGQAGSVRGAPGTPGVEAAAAGAGTASTGAATPERQARFVAARGDEGAFAVVEGSDTAVSDAAASGTDVGDAAVSDAVSDVSATAP
jgi:hypothetical protein